MFQSILLQESENENVNQNILGYKHNQNHYVKWLDERNKAENKGLKLSIGRIIVRQLISKTLYHWIIMKHRSKFIWSSLVHTFTHIQLLCMPIYKHTTLSHTYTNAHIQFIIWFFFHITCSTDRDNVIFIVYVHI